MTTTNLESPLHPTKHRTDFTDVLRAIIRENPKDSESEHKKMFIDIIQQEDYNEFLVDLIVRMLSLEYNKAVRSVFPPTKAKLRESSLKARDERRTKERDTAAAIKEAEEKIASRLLDFVTPSGKKLRDCTGGQCATYGGWFIKISKVVKPTQKVGDVLDNDKLKKLLLG
jgi:hypothetical protein